MPRAKLVPSPKLPGKGDTAYWALIEQWAKTCGSDGCTGVPDLWCLPGCREHDFHYRYGATLFGDPISFQEANLRFRQVLQAYSPLGPLLRFLHLSLLSPTAWLYWRGVARLGQPIWDAHRKRNLKPPIL